MKRVLILHGWGADSSSNWFPWLKQQLEQKGIEVYCPDLPNSQQPKQSEWLAAIRKTVGSFDSTLSIIGHSLGAVAVPRILETLSEKEKIDKAILVSGFSQNVGIAEINDFFQKPFDWKKIRQKAKHFTVINSDDDPYVPLEFGEAVAKELGVKLTVEHKAGHINLGTGYFKYERVLQLLGDSR